MPTRATNRRGRRSHDADDWEHPSRPHPLIELQQRVGNHAVQRRLRDGTAMRADDDKPSVEERAEQYIKQLLADRTRQIARNLEELGGLLMSDERAQGLVREVHRIFLATGAWTEGMVDALERELPHDYAVDQRLRWLRQDAREKAALIEGLDDPVEWQTKYYDRLLKH
jgi:hypothetical protein